MYPGAGLNEKTLMRRFYEPVRKKKKPKPYITQVKEKQEKLRI